MRKILQPLKDIPLKYIYNNKKVLITGGGTGLGKKMAETYSNLGAEVIISSRNLNVLQETAEEINNKTGNKVDYIRMNLKEHDSVLEMLDKLENEHGLPDVVINNAAGNFISPSEMLSYNGWNTILDIVLKGTLDLTLELGKRMIKSEKTGCFLNISTTYANAGSGFVLPSGIAKAGIDNMTKSLGAEWGRYGIRMLGVAPGPIYTKGAFDRLDPNGTFTNKLLEEIPSGRLGEKEELANLVSYLTSDYCSWITGQVINFDGGEVVRNAGEFNDLLYLSKEDWYNIIKNGKENNSKKKISKL